MLLIVRYVITCMVISRSSYCIFWRALSPDDCRVRLVRVTQHHFHIKSNHLVISNDPSFREQELNSFAIVKEGKHTYDKKKKKKETTYKELQSDLFLPR